MTFPVLQYNEKDQQKIIFTINQIVRGLNAGGSIGADEISIGTFPGVDLTGTTECAAAIQAAITSVGVLGTKAKTLTIPAGAVLKIATTIQIGDGTSSAVSTYQGVRIKGVGASSQGGQWGHSAATSARFVWSGAVNDVMFRIAGPLSGWGLENILLDGNSVAGVGLQVKSAQNGDCKGLTIIGCKTIGLWLDAFGTFPASPPATANCMLNSFRNTNIMLPNLNAVIGLLLSGVIAPTTPANACFNLFDRLTISVYGTGSFALYLAACDSNHLINTNLINIGGAGNAAVTLDYTTNPDWPCANILDGIDTAGFATQWQNGGTPSTVRRPNYALLYEGNGAVIPPLDNLVNLASSLGFVVYHSAGSNDQIGINSLFAAYKTIWLTDPAYSISGAINIPTGGRLVGMGSGATIITGTAGAAGISVPNQEACTIESLQLTGTMTNAISVTGSNELLIRRVWIEGTGITNGLNFSGLPYYARISECKINQVSGSSIVGTGSGFQAFLDLEGINFGGNGISAHGLSLTNIGVNMVDCEFLSFASAGVLASSTDTAAQPFAATHSRFDSCAGNGIDLTNFGSVALIGSWFSSNGGRGALLTGCENVTMGGNRCHYNGLDGYKFATCDAIEVSGDHVVNNNGSNTATTNGLTFTACSNVAITGTNSFNGALGATGHQAYAVSVDATCTNFTISGNGFDGNGTGPVNVTAGATNIRISDSFAPVTRGNLPNAAACKGSRLQITDGLAPVFVNIAAGGGTIGTPVYSEGTNWFCG